MAPIYFLFVITTILLAVAGMATSWAGNQLHGPQRSVESRNVSVGFSFQPSYVAGTVLFEDDDGNLEWHTEIDQSSDQYRKVMARLSLPSSRHLAPPYDDMGEMWMDVPRKALRESLKLVGLPASYEVGILGHVAQRVRTKLEKTHNIHIDDAVFTGSHLTALYQDDLEDIAAFLKIHYFTPNWQFRPFVWESASAYAGYGFGLCEHWRDEALCEKEMEEMENLPVMSVHFTRNALTVAMPVISSAVMAWEPDGRHFENFTLGSDAIVNYPTHDAYWTDVRKFLLSVTWVHPGARAPRRIIAQGDRADEHFLQVLREAVVGHWGEDEVGPIYSHLAESASSRGAAEFMRRGLAPWADIKGGEVEL